MKKKADIKIKSLSPTALCEKIEPSFFTFETTADIQPSQEIIGQQRAEESILFGIGMKSDGFNLFAMGPAGIGKRGIVRTILEQEAKIQPIPYDWCYVHHFEDPQKPKALELPAGWGRRFKRDINNLIEDISNSIPAMLESEEYRYRVQKITEEMNAQQEEMLQKISKEAKKEKLSIVPSTEGFTVMPLDEQGNTVTAEAFSKLPKKQQESTEALMAKFSRRLSSFLKQIPRLHREHRRKEKELRKEFTLLAMQHFFEDLKKIYEDFPEVIDYLKEVQADILLNIKDFIKHEESNMAANFSGSEKNSLVRYEVNLLVNHSKTKGAPIVEEENPTYSNLISRVEHIAQFGMLATNFTLIRAGALHRANGGYLILDARKLLQNPFAWEGLKRALFARIIAIEPPEQLIGVFSTVTLNPQPIPLKVKVVLYGDRHIYYLLCNYDPDFAELFKVAVDFEDCFARNEHNMRLFAELIASQSQSNHKRAFDRGAVAAIIDHGMRLAEDTQKICLHLRSIHDLVNEADYWAGKSGHQIVQATDVKNAIQSKIQRLSRVREHYFEQVNRHFILIQTSGKMVGQINGLSVVQFGSFAFGHPSKITATVRSGEGRVIDIQREIDLSGPIHSKGVLILSGFLGSRYIQNEPFSLVASLVFEQTYGMIDGDSASAAELCVLLSALANIPIKQSLAITGSINQQGQIQAIGGVNEKIEGFFRICQQRELTGDQGVIIPESNVVNLMLQDEIIEAVKHKKFAVYAIKHVDEAITLLSGLPAGIRGKNGNFPRNSLNYCVEKCLLKFANIKRSQKKITSKKSKK